MSEVEEIQMVIELKRQAIPLIEQEIQELEDRLILLRMLERYQGRIGDRFDRDLSERIDCILRLLGK